MKKYGVFINSNNINQVLWWNVVSPYIKAVDRVDVVDKATGKVVGCMFKITGLFAKRIASKNLKFIKNPVLVKF